VYWLHHYFAGKGSDIPSIYAVDSTNEAEWDENVRLPSCELLSSFLRVCLFVCSNRLTWVHDSAFCTVFNVLDIVYLLKFFFSVSW